MRGALLPPLLLVACADPEGGGAWRGDWPDPDLPRCDEARAQAGTGEEVADCVSWLVWDEQCPSGPWESTQDGLLFEGDVYAFWGAAPTFTITDGTTWEQTLPSFGEQADLPAVDFGTSFVLLVVNTLNSTCGADVLQQGLSIGTDGTYWLFVLYEDSSGACAEVCDMGWYHVLAYAIPREAFPAGVCAATINRCH